MPADVLEKTLLNLEVAIKAESAALISQH